MIHSLSLIVVLVSVYFRLGNCHELTKKFHMFKQGHMDIKTIPDLVGSTCNQPFASCGTDAACMPTNGQFSNLKCLDYSSWLSAMNSSPYDYCDNSPTPHCTSNSQCGIGEYCGGFYDCENFYCFPEAGVEPVEVNCKKLSNTTSCDISGPSNGLTQKIAQQCVTDGHLASLPTELFSCYPGSCSLYLSPHAARSLIDIATKGDTQMRIARAFESVAERYLIEDHYNGDHDVTCSNKALKIMNEDPIERSHQSGCAIDLNDYEAKIWSAALIQKGWAYTKPTIYTNHFEFMKCTEGVEVACRESFVNLWNNDINVHNTLGSTDYNEAMKEALGSLTCAGELAASD